VARSIREAIVMTNRVLKKDFGKTNVVALWTEKMLQEFTDEELEQLAITAEQVTGVTARRLLIRISNVKRERKNKGEGH